MMANREQHQAGLDQFLTAAEVAARLRVTTRTLYRRIETLNFPRPVKFSRNCVRWREREVSDWVESAGSLNSANV